MKRDRRRSLRLERLEGKALLSAVHGLPGINAPASAKVTAGAAGSVTVHSTVPNAATLGRTTNPGALVAHPIRPLGTLDLMSLSTNVSAGGFGTTARVSHDAAAGGSVSVRGLTQGPILASTRGIAESTNPVQVHSAPRPFTFSPVVTPAASSSSVMVSGGGLLGNASNTAALKTIGS
ncbi:MAG TPA: hypothetical protein VGH33_12720 [Isosphaeraceae bacterium]|jgi:hypothetical protein